MKNVIIGSMGLFLLSSCMDVELISQDIFFHNLTMLCGQKFEGEVVESIESDATWRESRIVMHVATCEDDEIRIPLSVGADASRTWIITKGEGTLTLKHDHRHEDGTPDEVTMYGGTTNDQGQPNRQSFPADEYSKTLFIEHGLEASVQNTWVMMIETGKRFSYRLERPGRTFQVDFDVTKPIED